MMRAILTALLLLQGAAATTPRPGAVLGRLQTSTGNPAAAIRVSAVPAPPPNIRPSDGQNYYSATAARTALTDANGRYRLGNLAPGRYFIVATVFGYSTFYPDTTNADDATVVTVGDGSPSEGVDFKVLMPPGGRVSGRVNTPPGAEREIAVLSGLSLDDIIEAPVGADGGFEFGHLPKGSYFLSLFPAPPGMPSRAFTVGESDTRVDLVRPTLRTIRGRIVVPSGPLPYATLGFTTDATYQSARINPDWTFRVQLQPARHTVEVAGLPSGYSLKSARVGIQDVTAGLVVDKEDISDLTLTIAPPAQLPRLRGTIVGVPAASLAGARVELTGRVIGTVEARVQKNGSFEFPALTPGSYDVRVPQVPGTSPSYVVIGWTDTELRLAQREPTKR
jgi:hypothetical protein